MSAKGISNNPKPGSALLPVLLAANILLVMAVILIKIVYNTYAINYCLNQGAQAFWLAEAGLERGKVEVVNNPAWYTDLPHVPDDDKVWLEGGAVGQLFPLGGGSFKLIREKGKEQLYAVGEQGGGRAIIKLKFVSFPFKVNSWKEL